MAVDFLLLTYNFLNFPTTIKQGSTVKATYTYLADGTKIKAVNAYNGGYDYVGSFKYSRNGSNILLESVATAGGRTYKTSGGYEARYFVTDHLGSTRLIAYPNGSVIEQNDYMPYGERHSNSSLATSGNPFLYNGKESQKSFGINYIDSEARFQRLDGAFNSIDPLCEKYYHISPYTYCASNPINNIDPDGNVIWIHYFDQKGELQKLKYKANMKYGGGNKFASTIINNLNAIYESGGNMMMNTLMESENAFNVIDRLPKKGTASFNADKNGGGTINAANINTFDSESVETVAHELFHAVQHEHRQGGPSIFNEVEAFVYGNKIATKWSLADLSRISGGSISGAGNIGKAGDIYAKAFTQLSQNNFTPSITHQAVNYFKLGASVNLSGTYNNFKLYPHNNPFTHSLLIKYLPSTF